MLCGAGPRRAECPEAGGMACGKGLAASGPSAGSLSQLPAGAQNVLAHSGVRKGHVREQILREIWGTWTPERT